MSLSGARSSWKLTGGVIASIIAFIVSFYIFNQVFGLEMWSELQVPEWFLVLALPLGIAWLVSTVTGGSLISAKKAAVAATVCLVVIAPISWWYFGEVMETGGEDQGQSSENQPEDVLFKYEASFQYLGSEDNGPITEDLYLVFPCPNVGNEAVVDTEKAPEKPGLENVTWQLWRYYENNDTLTQYLEVENDIAGGFIKPRTGKPYIHKPWVENTSHGPKIWYQLDWGDYNSEENKVVKGTAAFYQNEAARIEAKFTVPNKKADEVTLVDNQGGVYVGADSYTEEGYKQIFYSMKVNLYKKVKNAFETVEEFGLSEDNQAEAEWVDMTLTES